MPTRPRRSLYIPVNYDLESVPAKWEEYAAYILSVINQRLVFEKLPPDSFVPLMSKLLKKVLPFRDYRKIIDTMISRGILEEDRSYQVGRRSKGYRLTAEYRGQEHVRHEINSAVLVDKLTRICDEDHKALTDPVHRWLFGQLQRLECTVPIGPVPLPLHSIMDKDWRMRHGADTRIHSNITNLASAHRQYLSINGETLSTIDICNSQPLFLGLILLNSLSYNGYLQTVHSSPNYSLTNINNTGEGENPPLCGDIPSDVRSYLSLCESGTLYEYLMTQRQITERDKAKKLFFQVLFSRNSLLKHLSMAKVIEREFPTLYTMMTKLKAKDHLTVSRMLLRVESDFVINQCCRRVMVEYPDMFVGTIHDCWLAVDGDIPTVQRIVQEQFGKLGIQPKLKVEYSHIADGE